MIYLSKRENVAILRQWITIPLEKIHLSVLLKNNVCPFFY